VDAITSRQNAVVKRFRALARTAPTAAGEILLDGAHLIHEALGAHVAVDVAVFAQPQLDRSPALSELSRRVTATGGRVVVASEHVFSAMAPVRQPSGVVAIARAKPVALATAFQGPTPLVLIVAGVQDPGNVGAIIRSAAALGATAVVATEGSANPFGWKALRGAMGATFRISVVAAASLDDVMAAARSFGVSLVAAVPRGGTPLPDARLADGCALVVGGEGGGLPEAVIAAARAQITIPMRGQIESLNVAIAAAVVLYEASRQRAEGR
jgi:TrmH family RNA methyltransferase